MLMTRPVGGRNTGGFTSDEIEARTQAGRQITLTDLERLLDLWVEHYPKRRLSAELLLRPHIRSAQPLHWSVRQPRETE